MAGEDSGEEELGDRGSLYAGVSSDPSNSSLLRIGLSFGKDVTVACCRD